MAAGGQAACGSFVGFASRTEFRTANSTRWRKCGWGSYDLAIMNHPKAMSVGQLKEMGYRPSSVKDELRRNLIAKLKNKQELFPGIIGYRDTVIPQIVNGILSRHDLLFLGLRGQAKTRILRMLPALPDEWMPTIAGVEINDDPLDPMTKVGKRLISEQGDDAKIEWVHRSDRYQEKLGTP